MEKQRAAGVRLLDLTVSNPTEVLQEYPHEAIRRAYAEVEKFEYVPNPIGESAAREAIGESYAERGISISSEQLLLTASTSEAYALLFKLFCDPGDEVLVPVPSYPLFEFLAALEAVRIVPYRLLYDGAWFIDFSHLRQLVSNRTRAIVVVNPNNPTGSFLKRQEASELFSVAEQYNLPVISDEVFMDYSFGDKAGRVLTLIGCDSILSFSLNGLSKAAGMPQMKLGWIAINGPAADRQIARERLEILLDTYLSVGTPVQRALARLLTIGTSLREQIANRAKRNFNELKRLLRGSAAHPLHTEGGWSAIIQLPGTSSEDVWLRRLIEEQHVVMQPGYFFDMGSESYVVASLITVPETFDEGVRRLKTLVQNS